MPAGLLQGIGWSARCEEAPVAVFMAHAPTDIPALLEEVERLRKERDEAR